MAHKKDTVVQYLAPLAQRFGFDPEASEVIRAMETTHTRFRNFFWTEFHPEEDAHILLLRREFLKVLCGVPYWNQCLEAMHKTHKKPKTKTELQQRVAGELDPEGKRDDPGYFFDPMKWNVDFIPSNTDTERNRRLALFIEGMIDQEDGLSDAQMSPRRAADIIVRERAEAIGKKRDASPKDRGEGHAFGR